MARSAAYKGLSKEAKAALKVQFDSELQPRVDRMTMIQLLPTPKQVAALKLWFKDARKTYNLATTHVLQEGWFREKCTVTFGEMEKVLNKTYVGKAGLETLGSSRHISLLRTPKVIRQQAVKSVIAHIKTFRTKVKKRQRLREKYPDAHRFRQRVKFVPGFKSRRMDHDTVTIEAVSLKQNSTFSLCLYKKWKFPKQKQKDAYVFRDLQTKSPVDSELLGHFGIFDCTTS